MLTSPRCFCQKKPIICLLINTSSVQMNENRRVLFLNYHYKTMISHVILKLVQKLGTIILQSVCLIGENLFYFSITNVQGRFEWHPQRVYWSRNWMACFCECPHIQSSWTCSQQCFCLRRKSPSSLCEVESAVDKRKDIHDWGGTGKLKIVATIKQHIVLIARTFCWC